MNTLIVISLEAWDSVWRRNQHLVAGLLRADRSLRVLFVEPSADPLHAFRTRRLPQRGKGLRSIQDVADVEPGRLWAYQPTKWLPRRVDRRSDARWAHQVTATARALKMDNNTLWINDPIGAALLKSTGWPSLYDITDDWLAADRPTTEHARLQSCENQLLNECHAIVVCSSALQQSKGRNRETVLIPNAVDVSAYRFNQSTRPADLPRGKIAMYVGTLHTDRLDTDLTIETARELPANSTLVLVGPNALPPRATEQLTRAGVSILGPKPSDAIPTYLTNADVLLVPHIRSEFTASLDPIKAYEYLAAQAPIVSTSVPGFQELEHAHVLITDRTGFPKAVATMIKEPIAVSPVADIPDWSIRVAAMSQVIKNINDQ